ncbi:MAG: hypothetical protein AAFY82_10615 [Pseudomonadota bacterium]
MNAHTLLASTALALTVALAAPVASAECDISKTKCAVNGGKCNIKFRNRTGDTGGSDGGSGLSQTSSAQTILVKALDDDADRVGNKLQIVAGTSKTMNIEKKAKKENGFAAIRMTSQDNARIVSGATMTCDEVKAILNGNGTCKVFHGFTDGGLGMPNLGYQCDGGNISGPK